MSGRRRALVVDDTEAHRQLMGAILASQGLKVSFAEDGERAVQAADAGTFDLILMDFQMPVLDGLSATRLVRLHEARRGHARAALYIVTTCDRDWMQTHARQAGADGYIEKPMDFEQLIRVARGDALAGGPAAINAAEAALP